MSGSDPTFVVPSVRVSQELVRVFRDPAAARGPVAPGQMWRLEVGGTAAPVVVVEEACGELVVLAVGEDLEFADAATVPVDDTVLGFEVGVWVCLEFVVPRAAAVRRLGELDRSTFMQLDAVGARLRRGETPGGAGAAMSGDLDPRLAYRSSLALPLHTIVQLAVGRPGGGLGGRRRVDG